MSWPRQASASELGEPVKKRVGRSGGRSALGIGMPWHAMTMWVGGPSPTAREEWRGGGGGSGSCPPGGNQV